MKCYRFPTASRSAPEEQLLQAVTRGHPGQAQRLLAAGADPNTVINQPPEGAGDQIPFQWAAVHAACSLDNERMLHLLIQHGADLDLRVQWGITPLVVACCYATPGLAIVKLLLQSGCNVNTEDDYKQSVLPIAICRGNAELAHTLLLAGCRLNTYSWANTWRMQGKRERDSRTEQLHLDGSYSMLTLALHYAWVNIATLLLVHGFNPNKYRLGDLLAALKASLGQVSTSEGCHVFLRCFFQAGYTRYPGEEATFSDAVTKYHVDETCAQIINEHPLVLPSLKQLCRVCIRMYLRRMSHGCSIWLIIQSLPLPTLLVEYLALKEFLPNTCTDMESDAYMAGPINVNVSQQRKARLKKPHVYVQFWKESCCCFK